MGEEVAFENGGISDFQWLVTLTLDRVILHTVIHHSSTSTYTPNSLKSKKLFVDRRTYKRTYVCTEGHLRPTLLGWLGGVDLITIHTLWQDHVWNKERRTETSCYSWMDCRWRVSGATWRTAIRRRRMCLSLPARSYGAARLNAREGEFSCKQSQKHIQHDWVMSRSTHN